jgi:predicted metal-dependent peptidase
VARSSRKPAIDPATLAFHLGVRALDGHPLFAPLVSRVYIRRLKGDTAVPRGGWAVVTSSGVVHCHPTRRASAEEWMYAIAHCLLHLGMGHVAPQVSHRDSAAWNAACDRAVELFLDRLKVGRKPAEYETGLDGLPRDENAAYEQLKTRGVPEWLPRDLVFDTRDTWREQIRWSAALVAGVRNAVDSAIAHAAGRVDSEGRGVEGSTVARAHQWFINNFPLLGALASTFELIEDPATCRQLGIQVAAVDPSERRIYVNPFAGLTEEETRFVIAHEILHVALRHQQRCQDRDPYLWNCAADYCINLWLQEMRIGEIPSIGLLLDPSLKGLSAETVYDRIAKALRRHRRLGTFAGTCKGDILGPGEWWQSTEGAALDDFYRSALAQGLSYHESCGAGSLPAGLEEEVRAQIQPPIPWEVELSNWFDGFFAPIETRRSYFRPSRRQAATPDIPRPRTVPTETALDGRTFGVVLDTSGSMDRILLARALGAISAYAMSRDVPAVRVVYCDAHAYDAGYLAPEAIGGRVKVKGRGGTILQPGIDALQNADDFPADGPILIITDTGMLDKRLQTNHAHAYLVPQGQRLPFPAKGEVFEMVPSQAESAW